MIARTRSLPLTALVVTLALAGCGDGGVATTPTPTPSPAPTYTTISALTAADHTFHPAGITLDLRAGGGFYGTASAITGSNGFTVEYKASTSTYTLTSAGGTVSTFGPGDLDSTGALTGSPGSYAKVDPSGANFEVFAPGVPEIGGVPLTYTAVGSWTFIDSTNAVVYLGVAGSSTLASDMPKSGTATYTAAVDATVAEAAIGGGYNIYNIDNATTATFSADFGTGAITTSVALNGTPSLGGPSRDFGTFTGTGTIASGTPGFGGTFAGTTTSAFSGGFFGPQAAEMAYDFHLSTSTAQAIGVVWGKKN